MVTSADPAIYIYISRVLQEKELDTQRKKGVEKIA